MLSCESCTPEIEFEFITWVSSEVTTDCHFSSEFFPTVILHIIYIWTNNEKLGWPLPDRQLAVACDETRVMNSNSISAVLETRYLVFYLENKICVFYIFVLKSFFRVLYNSACSHWAKANVNVEQESYGALTHREEFTKGMNSQLQIRNLSFWLCLEHQKWKSVLLLFRSIKAATATSLFYKYFSMLLLVQCEHLHLLP